jgi:GDP-L-fucose synthase
MTTFWRNQRILITGASGFIGHNLRPVLQATGGEIVAPTHADCDLLEQVQVRRLFADVRPQVVFHLAGLVGGNLPNQQRPAEFCQQNLLMNTLVFHEAHVAGVQKLITCMGGCSYPRTAASPLREDQLWDGYPQPESAPYSTAKRMTVVLSEAYRRQYGFNSIVLVLGNVYGPFDNFSLTAAHVIPALIRKVSEAKQRGVPELVMWGSGAPTRDFVYVGDAVAALVLAAEIYDRSDIINISSGTETSIQALVELTVSLTGYTGKVVWDRSKPEGQGRRVFDVTRMQQVLGFRCRTTLEAGLRQTIEWFAAHHAEARL